jgi:hypothetical protein
MTEDRQRSKAWFTKKWGVKVMLSLSPLYLVFVLIGDPGRAVAAWICAFTIVFLTRHLWHLRTRTWFWVLLSLVVVGHAWLLLSISIPEPRRRLSPFGVLLPIFAVHFFLLRGIFWLAERLLEPRPLPDCSGAAERQERSE